MTTLERAALALGDTPDLSGGTLRKALMATGSPDRGEQTLRYLARAVIAAIREPSEGIDNAVIRYAGDTHFRRKDGSAFSITDVFRAGIDALLEEGK